MSQICLSFSLSITNALGQNLFESIKNEPFSIPEDDGNDLTHTFFNPNREGWLLKLGKGEDSPSSSEFCACLPPITNTHKNPPASPLPFPPVCCGGVRLTPAVETSHLLSSPSPLLQALTAQKGTQKDNPSPLPVPSPIRAKLAACMCVSTIRHHISGEHHGCFLGADLQGEMGGFACVCASGACRGKGRMAEKVTNGF